MIDTTGIDMITSAETRTTAILSALSLYLEDAHSEGMDAITGETVAALVWQAQINMSDLRDGIAEVITAIEKQRFNVKDEYRDLVPTRADLLSVTRNSDKKESEVMQQ